MIINGVEIQDIDMMDADVAERYECAMKDVTEKMNAISPDISRSQAIRQTCTAVFSVFDKVFGNGTAVKVFGKTTNMTVCIKAFEELVTAVNRIESNQVNDIKQISYKYNNRQQKSRKKHKNGYVNRR